MFRVCHTEKSEIFSNQEENEYLQQIAIFFYSSEISVFFSFMNKKENRGGFHFSELYGFNTE